MASLYSRYIPPSKKSTPSTPQKSSVIVESQITLSIEPAIPTPPPTVADASATYTRYVPPLRTKIPSHSKSVEPITEQSTPQSTKRKHEEVVEHESAQNSKKSKKSKNEENNDRPVGDTDEQPESPVKPKKVKKEKKKKVSEEVADEMEEAEGDKHRALLAKREKSLRKAEKLARKAKEAEAEAEDTELVADNEPVELHALEPLPQPEPLPEPSGISAFSALPSWLASPIRISPKTTAEFTDLGLEEAATKILQTKGFNQAFAVQAAVLPLLLPGPQQQPGDVLVSAATGSGKTLSYVLPMVRDLSFRTATKLRGLIVMPTRELVSQARDVCEICATAFSGNNGRRVKIGTAIGSQALKAEQSLLMDAEQVYDPEEYRKRELHRNAKWENSSEVGMDDAEDLYEDAEIAMPDHIMKPTSKVDILICTPGRLVEHLKSTPGFTLDFVNWLVIDEADKLLDQSFQQWIGTVIGGLPQQKLLAKNVRSSEDLGITKIILSATLTKDIGQLNSLKLRRPKLVILEGSETEEMEGIETEQGLALPATLHESAIKVDEEGEKPLYLIDLLQSKVVVTSSANSDTSSEYSDSSSDSTSSDEDSDDTSSDDSSSDSDSSSSSDSDSDVSMADASLTKNAAKLSKTAAAPLTKAALSEPHGVLIFTKSNESAVRLSRLIALIKPSFASSIGTLTSTIRNSARRHTLGAFQAGKLSILVASDLVSRGLDLPNLAHVINYDIPTSLTSYVHRVGRTARAGKEGHAWTLFTNTEGRWFWNEIARADLVKRSSDKKVIRMRIDAESFGDDLKTRYEEALQILSQEASGEKRA